MCTGSYCERFKGLKDASPAKTVNQHLVPIEVPLRAGAEADVNIVNKNNPAVNNVRDNVDARPRRNATLLNADILCRLRSLV